MMHAMPRAMKSTLACAGLMYLTMVLSAQTASAQAPNWQTYSYPADGFSASFPVQPEEQKQNVATAAGTFELRSYIGTIGKDGEVAMFVGVIDYGNATAGKDPDDQLQGAKNGALQNASAHLLSETKTTLGIYHGLTFEAESDAAHFYARIYIVGSVLYQTLVVVPLGKPYADTARFLDSFQLIARTAP
jgi:hypothetical protein